MKFHIGVMIKQWISLIMRIVTMIFSATNEFASVCIQDDESIDISITKEKEEVPMEDVEMDDDVDHSNTNKAL
ncbi:hypothetical protein Tco_0214611 [Tanacetum coccineum]